MKTILVPTDFSAPAENAAQYAYWLAKNCGYGLKLCNSFLVPVNAPMAAQVAWPLEDYDSVKKETERQLHRHVNKLIALGETNTHEFQPPVTSVSECGAIVDMIGEMQKQEKIPLVVMGMSGAGALTRFFLGSTSSDMIDKTTYPLLLVPAEAKFNTVKKIAFATDLNPGDITAIESVATFARYFNAEILLVHVDGEKHNEKAVEDFLNKVTCSNNYPLIYYRHIKNNDIKNGLNWVAEHGHIDMLALLHRKHGFIDSLLNSSLTQHIAREISLPLLVMPDREDKVYPVF